MLLQTTSIYLCLSIYLHAQIYKSPKYQEHPGNIRLSLLIESFKGNRDAAARGDKAAISEQVVKMIKESRGRFLKREEDCDEWVEVTDDIAETKVKHGFRTRIKKNDDVVTHYAVHNPGTHPLESQTSIDWSHWISNPMIGSDISTGPEKRLKHT